MTSPVQEQQEPNHKVMYIVIGIVLAVLIIIGLFTYRSKEADAQVVVAIRAIRGSSRKEAALVGVA